jgi:hypothetical protein
VTADQAPLIDRIHEALHEGYITNYKLTITEPRRHRPRPYNNILRRSFPLSDYTVTFTLDLSLVGSGPITGLVNVEWAPDAPRSLSKAEIKLYRKRRGAIFQEIADITGGSIAVVDV